MNASFRSSGPSPDRHGQWGIQSLWEQLLPWLPDLSIEVVEQIESTNLALMGRLRDAARNAAVRGIRADDLAPSLLVAIQQTQGRGRLGRSWESAAGSSLTFSLSLPIQRADWSGLSLAVGEAVAQGLDPSGTHIGLKWPNDLWRMDSPGRGRKLGGVLIEALQVADQRVAVIGVGINLHPLMLSEAVASVAEFEPGIGAPQALARIMPPLARALDDFEREGFAGVAARYAGRDLLRGQAITTTDPRCPQGMSEGVAEDGALLLSHAGQSFRIVSGEVSVRPLPPASV